MTSSMMLLATLLAAQAEDARWLPFLGCWSLVQDEVREPVLPDLDTGAESDEEETPDRPVGLVCLDLDGASARMTTYSGDEAFLEETLVADGKKREVTQGLCHGWQQLEWSRDGRMLFTRSELACQEGRSRSVTGVSLLADPSTWVELQSVGSGDSRAVLIRRFRPASEEVSRLRIPSLGEEELAESIRARARIASRSIGIEEVIEASAKVAPEVVEAVLLERGGRFPLNRDELLRLSEASVDPGVIDLMVALSFPERFEVEREPAGGMPGGFGFGYDPFYSSPYAYPYYAAPFGYYYWYAPYDPVYVVPPIDSDGARIGRVVEGRGYTRVTRAAPIDSDGRRARRRGDDDGRGYRGGGSETSSSGGTVSREGYSRSGSGGRPAKVKNNQ